MVRHQPLQVYERQLCLSCITGIYGCRWKRYQRSHDDTTKWELLWSFILLFTFCLLLIWFYFWLAAHNDYNEFNWLLYNRSGRWSDGTVPILASTAAGFTYVTFLMVLALCHIALGQQLNLHWLHKIGVTAALLITVVGGVSVSQTWSEEWDVVPISLQATGPFLHIGALTAVTALACIVSGLVAHGDNTRLQVGAVLLYVCVLQGLYVAPLYITSPCIMDPSSLKPRPDVIGHHGAPQLAPENTLWSFQRALQMNVSGFEADVAISVDGVPFLMHDVTLQRTTDVHQVFPDRQTDDASNFNWTDLQQLNAGSWFLQDDPFWMVHSLPPQEKVRISNQSVCSLEQLLRLASYHNSSVVFRLRRPPPQHPHHHTWINDTLHTVLQAGGPQTLVMWTPEEDRAQVRQMSPALVQTSVDKLSPDRLRESGVSRLLLRYNQANTQEIRTFSQENISVVLFPVNDPWLFSVLWCSGVSAVSSEAPHVLSRLKQPVWTMRPDQYRLMWVSADIVSFAIVVGIFIFQNFHLIRYRTSRMRSYDPEQIMLSAAVRRSSRDVNVMKEKLIFSEVGNRPAEDYMDNGYDYYTTQ